MAKLLGSGYLLHEPLGRGAMGQVYAGSVRQSGRPVAVKILKPELVSDPEVVARFVQERSILMSIDDPHVVRVIDLVAEGETLAIVMELVQGRDLRRYLRGRGTLPPAQAVRFTGQLLQGVAAIHAVGIIHRDIKPENLLLDTSDTQPQLKLTDFGVARLSYGASLTKLSSLIGTPEYMAPELAEHDSATPAADLYSAGIVLYELLCGRTPFAGGHPLAVLRRQVDQAPPPIPGLPAELWDQIAWMLDKDPQSRPGSAAEAYAALAPLELALATLPALPVRVGPDADGPARSSRMAGTPTMGPSTTTGTPVAAAPGEPTHQATVLRYRNRAGALGPGGAASQDNLGHSPGPGGMPGQGGQPPGLARPPSRNRHVRRLTLLAVCVLVVAGLVTTIAVAATHSPAPHPPVTVASSTVRSATTRPTTARPTTTAPSPTPSAALSPTVAPSSGAPPTVVQSVPPSVVPVAAVPPSAPPPSAAPAAGQLSSNEAQLENMLNGNVVKYCTSAPAEEGGSVVAAINCDYVNGGPTRRPLLDSLSPGSAQIWFNNLAGGITNSNNCSAGQYLGTWSHNGAVAGPLGCRIESNGLLEIIWVVGNQVGVIAEGSDAEALFTWWEANACLVPASCPA